MAIFIYGTLRHEPLFTLVSGAAMGPAVAGHLPDMAVEMAADGPWPRLVLRPGAAAEGLLLIGLSPEQKARLDVYELPLGYKRAGVTVIGPKGPVAAQCYLPAQGEGEAPGRPWDLGSWVRDHAPAALLAAAEVDWGSVDPMKLREQWPMIRARAAARLRGATTRLPATLRHDPAPGDWSIALRAPMSGDFFRFAPILMGHRRFDGSHHRDLPREVMVGADAALVLPYDARRDRILLVEQFRAGPARRDDVNPWTLEPVAGMVDADETPEEAARRETWEEAHLASVDLRKMFGVYASPGNATDYFYCYLGLADLPDDHPRQGGLEAEHEDLRLHLVDFSDAMDLLDSGEVTAGPLMAMLLWLDRARPTLREAVGVAASAARP